MSTVRSSPYFPPRCLQRGGKGKDTPHEKYQRKKIPIPLWTRAAVELGRSSNCPPK